MQTVKFSDDETPPRLLYLVKIGEGMTARYRFVKAPSVHSAKGRIATPRGLKAKFIRLDGNTDGTILEMLERRLG